VIVFIKAEVFKKHQKPMAFALDHREPPSTASWATPRSSVHLQTICETKPTKAQLAPFDIVPGTVI